MQITQNILNPELDINSLSDELATNGSVIIENALQADVAEALYHNMTKEVEWQITWKQGNENIVKRLASFRQKSPAWQRQVHTQILQQAAKEFQFMYNRYPMIQAYKEGWNPNFPLHAMTESLNGQPFLNTLRSITGDNEIIKADAQACWYSPGCFLKDHDDGNVTDEDRRFAYVIGLTKDWEADWGGQLQFTEEGKVTKTITPSFNTITLFKVPQSHHVNFVAPYAGKARLTITGWLRADKAPVK